jgi:hypothetical protein
LALGIYSKPHPDFKLSDDGSWDEPLVIPFDGRYGGAIDTDLYIRNDDLSLWYDGIMVVPVDLSNGYYVNGSTGFGWKLIESTQLPVPQAWESVSFGNTLSISYDIGTSSLGDIITYLPFWARIYVPRNEPIKTIKVVTLRISATEHLVTS